NLHRLGIGDTQPVDEAALDAEPIEHAVDLRPAAVHHDWVDADLLHQRDVVREGLAAGAHRVTAVFDDDRLAGIAAQIRHRLGEDRGAQGRVRGGDLRGERGWGIHRCGLYRGWRAAATAGGATSARSSGSAKAAMVARKAAMPSPFSALVWWISGCAAGCRASSAARDAAVAPRAAAASL